MPHSRSATVLGPDTQGRAFGVVVIGASAGGIPALVGVLSELPASFLVPILVVQHLSATFASKLPVVLGYRTRLTVKWAEHDERMRAGTVYIAPPDRHLMVGPGGRLSLSTSHRVGWWRPAVDSLFESAADTYGTRAIAIVLSGSMWDGARGMKAVADGGGITLVQDEITAGHFGMPAAAIELGGADFMLSPRKIAAALRILTESAVAASGPERSAGLDLS